MNMHYANNKKEAPLTLLSGFSSVNGGVGQAGLAGPSAVHTAGGSTATGTLTGLRLINMSGRQSCSSEQQHTSTVYRVRPRQTSPVRWGLP